MMTEAPLITDLRTSALPVIDFWALLERARAELGRLQPPPAAVCGVVGPLDAALPIVRRLQRQGGPRLHEVVVLSARAEIVAEPSWTLVRTGSRLAEAVHRGTTALLVIDVSTQWPVWVGPLVSRLRRAGLGLVHYVVDGDPSDADLAAAHDVLGPQLALDVMSPIGPDRLVELVGRGEPLASVRGIPLTAELLVASRAYRSAARSTGVKSVAPTRA